MKNKCAVALLFSLAASGLLAAEAVPNAVYKWTDAKGVVHYGDRPAAVGEAARHESAIGKGDLAAGENPSAQRALANMARSSAESKRTAGDAEKLAKDLAAQAEARAKACQSAKEAQRVYASGGRISTVNENGEKSFLSESDILAKQTQVAKSVDDACSTLKPSPAQASPSAAAPVPSAAAPAPSAPAAAPSLMMGAAQVGAAPPSLGLAPMGPNGVPAK